MALSLIAGPGFLAGGVTPTYARNVGGRAAKLSRLDPTGRGLDPATAQIPVVQALKSSSSRLDESALG